MDDAGLLETWGSIKNVVWKTDVSGEGGRRPLRGDHLGLLEERQFPYIVVGSMTRWLQRISTRMPTVAALSNAREIA